MAAERDLAEAQFSLGVVYSQGLGVPQVYAEAAKWFRMAAEQGHDGAQFSLGVSYDKGEGVIQNSVFAHMWFNLAAAQGNNDAANYRDIVAKDMTRDQIATAQKMASDWKPK